MRQEMAFYQLMIENSSDEVLHQFGLTRDMPVTHWGWYYPVSNYVQVEPVKKRSMTSVKRNIAKLIQAYEQNYFELKIFYKTCSHCSYFGICPAAQIQIHGCDIMVICEEKGCCQTVEIKAFLCLEEDYVLIVAML